MCCFFNLDARTDRKSSSSSLNTSAPLFALASPPQAQTGKPDKPPARSAGGTNSNQVCMLSRQYNFSMVFQASPSASTAQTPAAAAAAAASSQAAAATSQLNVSASSSFNNSYETFLSSRAPATTAAAPKEEESSPETAAVRKRNKYVSRERHVLIPWLPVVTWLVGIFRGSQEQVAEKKTKMKRQKVDKSGANTAIHTVSPPSPLSALLIKPTSCITWVFWQENRSRFTENLIFLLKCLCPSSI